MSLNNIFQKPINIDGIGNVYPIRLIDWDEFESYLNVLMLSKKHIPLSIDEDVPLLNRIFLLYAELNDDSVLDVFCGIFNLITRTNTFRFVDDLVCFVNENNQIVDVSNYEEIRETVLRQNIIFEPKIYKDPLMQQWAEKALKARQKNAANITLEDKISTVEAFGNKTYDQLMNYTMYQLEASFRRICKGKEFDMNFQARLHTPTETNVEQNVEHFAEYIDMYENPYDSLFKSKDKLKNINKALS